MGHSSLAQRQGDGIQEPKGTCTSGRVTAALPWREYRGNIVISLQMSDDESCCVSNTPPSPHNMGYITCSEDLRAVTEKNALSLREGLDSGNSMNPWNGGLRLGALSQSWSLGQKPGCSHTAFVCPASGSNALGLLDSKPARGKAWALWRSLGANQAPMVLIWDTV